MIAGDRSGTGKTTVTLALLSALRTQGTRVQAFKVGPDYIDPMFHSAITGRPAYNLDPVLTSEAYVQQCFQQHQASCSQAIIEGVMGLFDGAGGTDYGSTAHIARLLACPVLLVVDCARLSQSLAAIVHGYQTLDPRIQIAGVVLNRVGSDRHLAMLQGALVPLKMPILGVLRRDEAITLPDRHLGLVPTDELSDLPERFQHLATLGQRCFDWPQLEQVFKMPVSPASTRGITAQVTASPLSPHRRIRIGLVRDRAFNFYYADNLDLLTDLGAELIPFSPLADATLPPALDGLILGGGFPEVFAEGLSQNRTMRSAIAQHIANGFPTYAECGGLMYLCQTLVDFEGRSWPMVGTLPATTTMTGKLTLGYRHVTVQYPSSVVKPGQVFWGHEFHRSAIAPTPTQPLYALASYPLPNSPVSPLPHEGWRCHNLHASYVHTHWGTQTNLPRRFLDHCLNQQRVSH